MDIIFSREAAENLKERYTVLELETFQVNEKTLETFCIVPAEKIINEMSQLPDNVNLHEQLIQAIKKQEKQTVIDLAEVLRGKFGGELDSFYDIVRERFALEQ